VRWWNLVVHGGADLFRGPSDTLGYLLGRLTAPREAPERRALGFRWKPLEL
jgi:hypothetical protein